MRIPINKRTLTFICALVLVSGIGAYTVSATTSKKLPSKTEFKAKAEQAFKASLENRIARYEAFASSSLSYLNKSDRDILSKQIEGSVSRMKAALEDANGTSAMTKEDALLAAKINVLMVSFRLSVKDFVEADRKMSAVSSTTEDQIDPTATTTESLSRSSKIRANVEHKINRYVFSNKSSFSKDFIHKLVAASSLGDLEKLHGKKKIQPTSAKVEPPVKTEPVIESPVTTESSTSTDDVATSTQEEAAQTATSSLPASAPEQPIEASTTTDTASTSTDSTASTTEQN